MQDLEIASLCASPCIMINLEISAEFENSKLEIFYVSFHMENAGVHNFNRPRGANANITAFYF